MQRLSPLRKQDINSMPLLTLHIVAALWQANARCAHYKIDYIVLTSTQRQPHVHVETWDNDKGDSTMASNGAMTCM